MADAKKYVCSIRGCKQPGEVRMGVGKTAKFFCPTHYLNYNDVYDKIDPKRVQANYKTFSGN